MDAARRHVSFSGRIIWLVLLALWGTGAILALVTMAAARAATPAAHPSFGSSGGYAVQHPIALVMGWHESLGLTQAVAVLLILLAVWAGVLLFLRQPHPRQWATILVAAILCVVGLLVFGGIGAPLAEAREYLDPVPAYVAQLFVFAGAVLVFVTAVVRIRRAPEPVEPQQDRYHIASYTQFNKAEAAIGNAALAEARARAESVLPVDESGPD